jgi:hypothetical protein
VEVLVRSVNRPPGVDRFLAAAQQAARELGWLPPADAEPQ